MLRDWDNAIVTDINLAIYVAPDIAVHIHNNRGFYGLVINDSTAEKEIYFSDGTVIKTGPNEVHYFPKGSSYHVETLVSGGCYAINFDLLDGIDEKPFNIKFRNHEAVLKDFKSAVDAWGEKNEFCNTYIRECIYAIIIKINKEYRRSYMPKRKELLIKPAVDTIKRDFARCNLSVKQLAQLCGISEVYFRRLFIDEFSLSPKEYIINLRLEYAKRLLLSAQFSVSDIALMCGYFEPCHFSREFKKHFGISPAEYVKASQK